METVEHYIHAEVLLKVIENLKTGGCIWSLRGSVQNNDYKHFSDALKRYMTIFSLSECF